VFAATLRQSALAVGAAALATEASMSLQASPLGLPIGFQSWVVRDMLAKDFEGTLRRMAGLGYQTVEMCSPPDYVSSGFGPLTNLKAPEMRRIIEGKMQFQVAVISAGFQAATFFNKYPGRFISMHLADWSEAEKKSVPLGQGIVDWKKLFAAAKTGGVKNYFVEMDFPLLKPSCDYLTSLAA
jgi:sugar phosphate isomerase/epimerase